MARYKILPSAARNFGASFISVMNIAAGDYAMCHLVRLARSTTARELRIDLLSGAASPEELCTREVQEAIAVYVRSFPHHLKASGAGIELVASATLTVALRPAQQPGVTGPETRLGAHLVSTVTIVDDRGRSHEGSAADVCDCHVTKPYGQS